MEPVDFPLLAKHIREAHARAIEASCRSLRHAQWCGHLLLQAKDAVPHGHFEEWVVQNCGFTPQTARSYMRIARSCPLEPPNETSCREALRKLSSPPGPPRWRRPGPTPFDVVERMREFGITGDVRQVLRFLRSFGVRIRDANQLPNSPATAENESALPFSPPAGTAPAALPRPPDPGRSGCALSFSPWAGPVRGALPQLPGLGQNESALPICRADGPVAQGKLTADSASVTRAGDVAGRVTGARRPGSARRSAAPALVPREDSG